MTTAVIRSAVPTVHKCTHSLTEMKMLDQAGLSRTGLAAVPSPEEIPFPICTHSSGSAGQAVGVAGPGDGDEMRGSVVSGQLSSSLSLRLLDGKLLLVGRPIGPLGARHGDRHTTYYGIKGGR